MVFFAALFFP